MQSIKDSVRDIILHKVLGTVEPLSRAGWKVLVVDHAALRMISACCRMFDILDRNVTIVEDIELQRKPLPDQDAVYLVSPTLANVAKIKEDFGQMRRYLCAHIFFTDTCPENVLAQVAVLQKVIKTVKEININFVPSEARIFALDSPMGLYSLHSPHGRENGLARAAHQIASLCAVLGENPVVRYAAKTPMEQLGRMVQSRLDELLASNASMGSSKKTRAQLLLLDRDFDLLSPLVHSLTYQAAAYDLLDIPNDVYEYKFEDGSGGMQRKEAVLNEQDSLWVKFRHDHVSKVFKGVSANFKEFVAQKQHSQKKVDGTLGTLQLRKMMQDLPQHQQEMAKFSLHLELSAAIMREFTKRVEHCVKVEQNLVTGEDATGNKVSNLLSELSEVIVDRSVSVEDKLRVLAIYVICNGGMEAAELRDIMTKANIPMDRRNAIYNLQCLGVTVENKRPRKLRLKRPSREAEFSLSRWVPVLQDVLENLMDDKLSLSDYPCTRDAPPSSGTASKRKKAAAVATADDDEESEVVSARKRGAWAKGGGKGKAEGLPRAETVDAANKQRLIIFVAGAIGYNEMRVAYELSRENPHFDIFLGSHTIAAPRRFLSLVAQLSEAGARPMVPGFGEATSMMETDLMTLRGQQDDDGVVV